MCDLQEIATFLRQKNLPYGDKFFDPRWLARLALLTDITTHLNSAWHRHSRNGHACTHHRLRGKSAIVGGAIG